ncbi:hypothetical protein GOBAR_AA10206 [Gossypium barbadense]|uniref:Pentacotripeptide-repeat region of PRORP domain-containing protein n=1 Tax=Gossypium barbadense TaxID=3634 RepID=A0A2P5Y4A1_GOSBA|nr:hypothetical protein GOBAR_AA10206 [Gossypium barbadense]
MLQINELGEWQTHVNEKPIIHDAKPKRFHDEHVDVTNQFKVRDKVLLDKMDPRMATSDLDANESNPLYGTEHLSIRYNREVKVLTSNGEHNDAIVIELSSVREEVDITDTVSGMEETSIDQIGISESKSLKKPRAVVVEVAKLIKGLKNREKRGQIDKGKKSTKVNRILVDMESLVDILTAKAFHKMGLRDRTLMKASPVYGFAKQPITVKKSITLSMANNMNGQDGCGHFLYDGKIPKTLKGRKPNPYDEALSQLAAHLLQFGLSFTSVAEQSKQNLRTSFGTRKPTEAPSYWFSSNSTGKVVEAEKALRDMLNQGILPDIVVYTTLIDGFCKLGNIALAYKLLNEMQGQKIIPDLLTYTSIICGLCRTGKMTEACNIFQEMLGRGLEPDEFTYTALIDGYCKAGEMKEAFSLHNQMVQMGLIPNVVTYTALADGLCKCGEVDTANELLHEMCGRGLQPNIFTYNSLVNGLCKSGNIAQAIKLMDDMETAGLHPNVITYTTLMDAYCKTGEMDKAYELLRKMLDRRIQPTLVTFNVLMNGFCMSGMLEDGEKLLQWLLEKGIKPNATTYNYLMKQYCIRKDMRATAAMWKGMCAQGVMPDANSYNILIKGHCKARNMKEAWFLRREMIEKGYDLTATSYNDLIKGFIKRKKLKEAREIFDEMRQKGMAADKEIYCYFVDINYEEGSMETTLELCDEVIENCLVTKLNNGNK